MDGPYSPNAASNNEFDANFFSINNNNNDDNGEERGSFGD